MACAFGKRKIMLVQKVRMRSVHIEIHKDRIPWASLNLLLGTFCEGLWHVRIFWDPRNDELQLWIKGVGLSWTIGPSISVLSSRKSCSSPGFQTGVPTRRSWRGWDLLLTRLVLSYKYYPILSSFYHSNDNCITFIIQNREAEARNLSNSVKVSVGAGNWFMSPKKHSILLAF